MRATIARALVLACLAGACRPKAVVVDPHPVQPMKILRHANGLELRVPDGVYEVRQTPAGFRISPLGSAQTRTPVEVIVDLRAGRVPAGTFAETKLVRGRPFHFRVDVEAGGSGGDEHVLRAFSEAGTRHVWLEQGMAIEAPAKPNFTAAWQIIEGLEAPAP